jgi:hypothetical protein
MIKLINITQIACGNYHSLVILTNGSVFSFGRTIPIINSDITLPTIISELSNITQVCGGYIYSMFLDIKGNVFSMGFNNVMKY